MIAEDVTLLILAVYMIINCFVCFGMLYDVWVDKKYMRQYKNSEIIASVLICICWGSPLWVYAYIHNLIVRSKKSIERGIFGLIVFLLFIAFLLLSLKAVITFPDVESRNWAALSIVDIVLAYLGLLIYERW